MTVLLAALAGLLIVAGGVAGWGLLRPERTPAAGSPAAALPDLFTECAHGWCPAEPMCWGGLVANSGVPVPPRRKDCAEEHYWETFAAVPMPAGGVTVGDESLTTRPEVGAVCSAEVMAARSVDPARTRKWQVDAWPVPVGADTMLHCIASAPGGESTGNAFTSR